VVIAPLAIHRSSYALLGVADGNNDRVITRRTGGAGS
jgi:hypothetical protein